MHQISSLESLSSHFASPLPDGEWGILSLDLDQTLIQAKPTLGDEHWYRFVRGKNLEKGLDKAGHYKWACQIRQIVEYQPCEPAGTINDIVKSYREGGWSVNILTSRGTDMKEATVKHLRDSKLDFPIEKVIFYEKGADERTPKDVRLANWMKSQPQWSQCESICIHFVDDRPECCEQMAHIPQTIEKIRMVECFQYKNEPNPNLSQPQLDQLAVQLHWYQATRSIPYTAVPPTESDVLVAMEGLHIGAKGADQLPDQLYDVMQKMAEQDGASFSAQAK